MSKNFTQSELQTLHNSKFFEVKTAATKKIEHLFAEVRDELLEEIRKNKITFPKEVDALNGKIFRGENYQGLPYLVLDYPKHFSKDSVFAFRTMFWWGNFFSFTLHLQGKALESRREELINKIPSLKKKGLYLCLHSDPWQYHYETANYMPLDKLTDAEIKKIILEKKFVKFSGKILLKDHKKLKTLCKECFRILA